ncbi:hypothetical protein F5877DRAFT_81551 [Lentinula edodes]|nr:hypothetical protein F5877DRAFT_81551 [Lentinula edodes]
MAFVVERLCSAPAIISGRLLPQDQYGRRMSSSIPSTCIITEYPDIAVPFRRPRRNLYIGDPKPALNSGFVTGQVFVDVFTGKHIPPAASHLGRSSSPARTTSSSRTSDNSALRTFRGYLSYISDHPHYFEYAKSLERSFFLIGSAIIVGGFLDARGVTSTIGLPPHPALLVLNLSLLNNLAGSSFLPFRIGAIFATIKIDDEDDEYAKGITQKLSLRLGFGFGYRRCYIIRSADTYSMTVDASLSSPLYNSTLRCIVEWTFGHTAMHLRNFSLGFCREPQRVDVVLTDNLLHILRRNSFGPIPRNLRHSCPHCHLIPNCTYIPLIVILISHILFWYNPTTYNAPSHMHSSPKTLPSPHHTFISASNSTALPRPPLTLSNLYETHISRDDDNESMYGRVPYHPN